MYDQWNLSAVLEKANKRPCSNSINQDRPSSLNQQLNLTIVMSIISVLSKVEIWLHRLAGSFCFCLTSLTSRVSGHSHPHINCLSISTKSDFKRGRRGVQYSGNNFFFRDSCVKSLYVKASVWVWRGISWWRIDSLQFSVVPQIEFSPFVTRGEKALMLENYSLEALDLLLTSAIGWKEKLFVIWTRKNLFLYVTLKILEVFLNSSTVYEGFSGMVAGLVCF